MIGIGFLLRLAANPRLLIAGAVAIGLAYGAMRINNAAFDRGFARSEARHAAAMREAEERIAEAAAFTARAEAERLKAEAERARLASELEDQAHADPGASRPSLGADSVRRLNSR